MTAGPLRHLLRLIKTRIVVVNGCECGVLTRRTFFIGGESLSFFRGFLNVLTYYLCKDITSVLRCYFLYDRVELPYIFRSGPILETKSNLKI